MQPKLAFVGIVLIFTYFAEASSGKKNTSLISEHSQNTSYGQTRYQNWFNLVGLLGQWTDYDTTLEAEFRNRQQVIKSLKEYLSSLSPDSFDTVNTNHRELSSFMDLVDKLDRPRTVKHKRVFSQLFEAMVEYEELDRDSYLKNLPGTILLLKAAELKVLALSVHSSTEVLDRMIHELQGRVAHIRSSLTIVEQEVTRNEVLPDLRLHFDDRSFQVEKLLFSLERTFLNEKCYVW